jgi:hypothetical protein
LDEEKSKHAGLAQENRFGSAWSLQFAVVAGKERSSSTNGVHTCTKECIQRCAPTCTQKNAINKYDPTAAGSVFLIGLS